MRLISVTLPAVFFPTQMFRDHVTYVEAHIILLISESFHQTSHSPLPQHSAYSFLLQPPLALLYHIFLTPPPSIHLGKGYSKLHSTACLSVLLLISRLFSRPILLYVTLTVCGLKRKSKRNDSAKKMTDFAIKMLVLIELRL